MFVGGQCPAPCCQHDDQAVELLVRVQVWIIKSSIDVNARVGFAVEVDWFSKAEIDIRLNH